MSPQAIKSGMKSYCSNKISHNFKQEKVYFQICVGNFGYYYIVYFLVFLSSLLIKICLICVTSEATVVDKL